MNHVERFRAVMGFEQADRLPVVEWASWWNLTIERWWKEGLPTDLEEAGEIRDYFGLDCYRQCWLRHRRTDCPGPKSHGAPLIATEAEYDDFKNSYLFPENGLETDTIRDWETRHSRGETVIWFTLEGFFWFPRTLLGIEPHLYAFFDKPELMHRINSDLAEFHLKILERLFEICSPDFMTFAEDLSYNNGPMISKECYDEFLAPYYKKVIPVLEEHGVLPFIDSDGDITSAVPWFEEVGIVGVLPLERKAGVDVAEIRRNHPRFRMLGAFDKTVMSKGEEAMRAEFERLLPVMRSGGFIPSVDHQTPPDVSLETYGVYLDLLNEYCRKAATPVDEVVS